MNNTPTPPLTRDAVINLARAINRLHALNQQVIKTAESDVEIQSLSDVIATQLTFHAAEFINAYLCVCDEYSPLVASFASLQTRAANMVQMRAKQLEQSTPAPAENVITPSEFKQP